MDKLDDPESTHLTYLVFFLPFNLMFNNETIGSFKTYFIRRTRASVSAIVHELGKKSKNYYHMRDVSIWNFRNTLKDEIDNKPCNTLRRSRKNYTPNGVACSSARLRNTLSFFGDLSNGNCLSA